MSLFLAGQSSMRRPGPLCCTPSPNAAASTRFPALCRTETLQRTTHRLSRHGGNSFCTVQNIQGPVMSHFCHIMSQSPLQSCYHVQTVWSYTSQPSPDQPTIEQHYISTTEPVKTPLRAQGLVFGDSNKKHNFV